MTETSPQFFRERAEALRSFGRPDEAIAELHRGLAEFPQDADLQGDLAWLLFFFRGADSGPERITEAEDAARATLVVLPHDARALTVLCEIAVQRGLPDEALRYAAEQSAHYPNAASSHLNIAYALLSDERGSRKERARRHAEVHAAIDRALALDPEGVETLRRSAIMLRRISDTQAASDVLDRALALAPTNSELLLLAAERESGRAEASVHGMPVSAAQEAAALRLLTGVLAEEPERRGVARAVSDQVWFRTQLLATLLLWFLAALLLFAYLLFGEPLSGTSRARVKGVEAFLLLPFAWVFLFVTIRRKGLPPRFLRRLYRPVWWVWIGLVIAAASGLAMLFFALVLLVRSGETMLALQGSYVGGITAGIGFVAATALVAELLIVFARFRSEEVTGLYPADAEGAAAARAEVRSGLWGVIRAGVAVLIALVPVYAASFASRPEAAGGFAVVAVALGAPPLVTLALRLGRWGRLRARGEGRRGRWAGVAYAVAVLLAVGSILGSWLAAIRHEAEFDPPPTPQELQLQEQQSELNDRLDRGEELRKQLEDVSPYSPAPEVSSGSDE